MKNHILSFEEVKEPIEYEHLIGVSIGSKVEKRLIIHTTVYPNGNVSSHFITKIKIHTGPKSSNELTSPFANIKDAIEEYNKKHA